VGEKDMESNFDTLTRYTEEKIKEELDKILLTKDFTIKPVGNHHLKRHLVYQIEMGDGEKYIFKLYYRDRRRSREIASLKLLEDSEIKCPKIFKYGSFEEGHQWLITKYIDGTILENILHHISYDNRLRIFEEMGTELGKLHTFKSFDFFGEWDEEGRSMNNIKNYYDYFVQSMEKDIKSVMKLNLPEKDLLLNVINTIRDNYHKLNIDIQPRLMHNDFDGRNILVKEDNGVYKISGVIDFEGCYPNNAEENLVQLYFRYFLENKEYENAFFNGYEKYLHLDSSCKERLNIYFLCFVIGNCTWAYNQAPDYYNDNIKFLKKLLSKEVKI
jgi:Ser/Thr protein kinase RdoA (MazF antagonist)